MFLVALVLSVKLFSVMSRCIETSNGKFMLIYVSNCKLYIAYFFPESQVISKFGRQDINFAMLLYCHYK